MIMNEIWPHKAGSTVLGKYSYQMNTDTLCTVDRMPWLVIEEGPNHEMIVRAAQEFREQAEHYMKPDRWLVHPYREIEPKTNRRTS